MKLAPRAIVDDAFIHVMLSVYRSILTKKNAELATASRYAGNQGNVKPIIARLTPIIDGINIGRVGLDYEKTRLRILPFTKFSALIYGGQTWLTGRTVPVIITDNGQAYHMGPYKICIPVSTFERGSLDYIHFIPLKFPTSYNRHPHHHGNNPSEAHFVSYALANKIIYPLADKPGTCWGNYGALIVAIANDGDIPELFRQLYIYLTRYNPASPLIHEMGTGRFSPGSINWIDFDTTKPWEDK
jgi:hypothetical protein